MGSAKWRCLNKDCGHEFSAPLMSDDEYARNHWRWCPKCQASSEVRGVRVNEGGFGAADIRSAVMAERERSAELVADERARTDAAISEGDSARAAAKRAIDERDEAEAVAKRLLNDLRVIRSALRFAIGEAKRTSFNAEEYDAASALLN